MSYGQKLDYQTIGIDALQQFPKVNDVKLEDYIIIYMYKYYIYMYHYIYIHMAMDQYLYSYRYHLFGG